ncbi:MAG TPA: TraB/GumN family protein [Gammaproteobacteria bacterium]|nr:TraB/GumN family protein [Gammaproteobacteria bacterium]
MIAEKAKYRLRWAIWCLLLAGKAAFAASLVNSDALLWKVTGEHGEVSHVFGTIHSDDPRVLRLKPAAQAAFDNSERLVLEIVLTPEGMLNMMTRMYRRDGSELKPELPEPVYMQTVAAFKERGLDESWVNRLTIWGAAMTLMIPQSEGTVLDLRLQAEMQGRNKPIFGLETVDSQLAVFADLDKESQIRMLTIALGELHRLDETTQQLIRYYLREDIAAISNMENEYHTGENRKFMVRLMDRLIDERNGRMTQAMLEHLRAGGAFVAIGALHLPGKNGVINLLRKAGYQVEPVRPKAE